MERFKLARAFTCTILIVIQSTSLLAQSSPAIKGTVTDQDNVPVCFSNVILKNLKDSTFVSGTTSDSTGMFDLEYEQPGKYFMAVSCIGFEPDSKIVEITETKPVIHSKPFRLKKKSFELREVKAIGQRLKAKQSMEKTTYFVNQNMHKASSSATDIIKHVPGIQVDLFRNVSLEGREDILILIDGVERSPGFLAKMDSRKVDKIEVNNRPGPEYRSNISGVINIVTVKEKQSGISGHLYGEIPGSKNEIYAMPNANLSYSAGKMTMYASYEGEFSYFDIEAKNKKWLFEDENHSFITSSQFVKQENQSHKFNLGFDYFFNDKNQLNILGFVNPYSNEHDGRLDVKKTANETNPEYWNYEKDDSDKNRGAGSSIYYRHHQKGKEFSAELSYYNYKGHNKTEYLNNSTGETHINDAKPIEDSFVGRIQFSLPIGSALSVSTGMESKIRLLSDEIWSSFNYREDVSAGFASLTRNGENLILKSGARLEHSQLKSGDNNTKKNWSLFPFASAQYNFTRKTSLRISYRRSILRPHIYHLNPNASQTDPFTQWQGNPALTPAFRDEVSMDFSFLINNNYISVGPFFSKTSEEIEILTTTDNDLQFVNTYQNPGTTDRMGIKLTASLSPIKSITFNPFLKIFNVHTTPNELATTNYIKSKNDLAWESGFSLSMLLKNDISISAMLKNNSKLPRIQNTRLADKLYFVSVEKEIYETLKVGITTAIPFQKEFTYQGHEITRLNFEEYAEDNIQMSDFPFWFKIKYTFKSGKKTNRIDRPDEFKNKRIKKGF